MSSVGDRTIEMGLYGWGASWAVGSIIIDVYTFFKIKIPEVMF